MIPYELMKSKHKEPEPSHPYFIILKLTNFCRSLTVLYLLVCFVNAGIKDT